MFSSRRTGGRPEVWSCCNLAALKVNRTYRTLDVFSASGFLRTSKSCLWRRNQSGSVGRSSLKKNLRILDLNLINRKHRLPVSTQKSSSNRSETSAPAYSHKVVLNVQSCLCLCFNYMKLRYRAHIRLSFDNIRRERSILDPK